MDDVYVFSALAVLLMVGVGLFYKGFQLMTLMRILPLPLAFRLRLSDSHLPS